MSRITHEDAISANSQISQFALQDDGDCEVIRILVNSWGEVPVYLAHSVRYKGVYKYWDCQRNSTQAPIADCPMCQFEGPSKGKYFIPIYNYTQGRFQYWTRGPAFLRVFNRLADELYPLSEAILEVERVGEKGSRDTRYEFTDITDRYINNHAGDRDIDYSLSDLDIGDPDSVEAGIFIQKSPEEIEYYMENGVFEDDDYTYDSNNRRDQRGASRGRDDSRGEYSRGGDRYPRRGRDRDEDSGYRPRSGYSSRRGDTEDGGYTSRASGGVRRREF